MFRFPPWVGSERIRTVRLYDIVSICFNGAIQLRAAQRAWLEPSDTITPSQQGPLAFGLVSRKYDRVSPQRSTD